jgi:hypothetical protein
MRYANSHMKQKLRFASGFEIQKKWIASPQNDAAGEEV